MDVFQPVFCSARTAGRICLVEGQGSLTRLYVTFSTIVTTQKQVLSTWCSCAILLPTVLWDESGGKQRRIIISIHLFFSSQWRESSVKKIKCTQSQLVKSTVHIDSHIGCKHYY